MTHKKRRNKAQIKYLLELKGMTLSDIAKNAGVSLSYINQVISGSRPCSKKVMAVFVGFGISQRLLRGGDGANY